MLTSPNSHPITIPHCVDIESKLVQYRNGAAFLQCSLIGITSICIMGYRVTLIALIGVVMFPPKQGQM